MTSHERFLVERLQVEVSHLDATLGELRASGCGEIAALARVASGALLVMRQASEKMSCRAREIAAAEEVETKTENERRN